MAGPGEKTAPGGRLHRHLHRYLAEFDFRYTNRNLTDGQRTALAIKQSQGKRLVYRCDGQEGMA